MELKVCAAASVQGCHTPAPTSQEACVALAAVHDILDCWIFIDCNAANDYEFRQPHLDLPTMVNVHCSKIQKRALSQKVHQTGQPNCKRDGKNGKHSILPHERSNGWFHARGFASASHAGCQEKLMRP
eukprot:1161944-Pelagomonas_calceolata.AAC.4